MYGLKTIMLTFELAQKMGFAKKSNAKRALNRMLAEKRIKYGHVCEREGFFFIKAERCGHIHHNYYGKGGFAFAALS